MSYALLESARFPDPYSPSIFSIGISGQSIWFLLFHFLRGALLGLPPLLCLSQYHDYYECFLLSFFRTTLTILLHECFPFFDVSLFFFFLRYMFRMHT